MTPYVRIRRTAAGFEIEGTPTCELGHRLPDGDGIFAAWTWNGERLTVTNDRYGFYPLFYCARDGEIALSSSLAELVRRGAPTELDDVALAAFRYLGFFIQEDTPFKAIKVLPPAARFEWNGQLTLEDRRPLPATSPLEITREEAMREFARLLREAVQRRVEHAERVVLPLSGGRDSRHILLALCELGRPPDVCISVRQYPPIQKDDVEVARVVAGRLGVPHVHIGQLPRFEAELRKNAASHLLAARNAWWVAVADYVRGTGGAAFDGIGGDVLAPQGTRLLAWHELYRSGRLDELADALSQHFGSGSGRALSRSRSPRSLEVWKLARGRILGEMARYSEAPSSFTMFFLWNDLRRSLALMPFGIGSDMTFYCPYLDHRLYDFLASLPAEIALDGSFQTDTISEAYPQLADLPYAGEGRGPRLGTSAPLAARAAWYAIRHDPARIGGCSVALSRLALATLSGRYRERNQVDNPQWLLHGWQLEDLRRGRLTRPL